MPSMFFNQKIKNHRINSLLQKKNQLKKLKLDFIVTPWDENSFNSLLKIGVDYFKIASIDANNYHFCEFVAKHKKPTATAKLCPPTVCNEELGILAFPEAEEDLQ